MSMKTKMIKSASGVNATCCLFTCTLRILLPVWKGISSKLSIAFREGIL